VKSIFAIAFFVLSACGSAEQLAESLDKLSATPVPDAQPGVVWTATPLPAYPEIVGATPAPIPTPVPTATQIPRINRSAQDDYKKISQGMTREEILLILGDFHRRNTKTFCSSGECEDYEYLTWYYKDSLLSVTIKGGFCVSSYTM
jgi:hypothetical protein